MIRLAGVNVPVADMERAVAFYSRLFARRPTVSDARYSLFDLDGRLCGLLAAAEEVAGQVPQPLLYTPDLDVARSDLEGFVPGIGPLQEHDGYRVMLIRDPDGNWLEVYTETDGPSGPG